MTLANRIALLVPMVSFAINTAHADSTNALKSNVGSCDAKTYQQLVSCGVTSSTDIAISVQTLKSAEGLVGIAEQRLNPELNADSVHRSGGSESNATLLFPIRLGGKRDALIREAKSEAIRVSENAKLDIQQSRLSFMLGLYRLSQIKRELGLANETLETYSKIVGQFEGRPALSPEQDVSLSVFRMALADYRLRVTTLQADELGLYRQLTAATGLAKETIASNLPRPKKDWLQVSSNIDTSESPQVKIANADLQLARSRKDRADSEAWPDLRIGPSVKGVKENGETNTYIGAALSIPLPVLNRNAAGKSYAEQKVVEAELTFAQAQRRSNALRDDLLNRYTQIRESLEKSLSLDTLKGKHERIEKQFFKGLVPSALVIEGHRQLFDLEQRRNLSELEAIEALGRLLILENKFSEVTL